MGELSENHSSTLRKFTRVKSAKKQAKKTIGITLSPHLLAEARNLHACMHGYNSHHTSNSRL
jgi:hypothetical protein